MINFLEQIRKQSNREKLDPKDWRKQVIWPLIQNENRDDFKERESSEQNPDNYVVEIFPKPNTDIKQNSIYKNILNGNTVSGYIDLRLNTEGKYTIWLGDNHQEIVYSGMQITDDININQYIIGIKVTGKDEKVRVVRDMIGQSCKRTPEQIKKIIDAVDGALKNNFKL